MATAGPTGRCTLIKRCAVSTAVALALALYAGDAFSSMDLHPVVTRAQALYKHCAGEQWLRELTVSVTAMQAFIQDFLSPENANPPNILSTTYQSFLTNLQNLELYGLYTAFSRTKTLINLSKASTTKVYDVLSSALTPTKRLTVQVNNKQRQAVAELQNMMNDPDKIPIPMSHCPKESARRQFLNNLKKRDNKYKNAGSLNNVRDVLRSEARERANAEAMRQYGAMVNQFINAQSPNNNKRRELSNALRGSSNRATRSSKRPRR
jgi:hypothetical protein